MNKKVFITKYEYLHSYTRCQTVVFLKNQEIDEAIKLTLNNFSTLLTYDEDNDSEDFDENEFDSYESYRENLINGLQKVDISNLKTLKPEVAVQIIEGLKIDKLAKEYIANEFNISTIIDYDDPKYKTINFDNEKAAAVTNEDLIRLQTKKIDFILFQPTFIAKTAKDSYYVTKCDALVYKNNEFILVEVKGTTSSKIIHAMDFLYQKNVIENSIYEPIILSDFRLCLVAYCRSKKNTVPLILDPYCNLTKTASNISEKQKFLPQHQLIAIKQKNKLGKNQIPLYGLLNETLSPDDFVDLFLETTKTEAQAAKKAEKKVNEWLLIIQTLNTPFEERIDFLFDKKIKFNKNLVYLKPCENCKSSYKNCEYWLKCRELFKLQYKKDKHTNKALEPFIYSGKIMPFKVQLKTSAEMKENSDTLLPIAETYPFYLKDEDFFDAANIKNLWELLQSKSKRVYFDFESINTAIRPMDDVFPFNQVITQNSIIKTTNFYDEYYTNDMIIDPKHINLVWIKSIIDNLYEEDDCWYIVYNKNFECTRLKEMALLINEQEYTNKVKKINENIFDLADFFNKDKKTFLLYQLRGYYSIKKLLELIPQVILDDTKTVSYHSLDIYNGAVAQNATTLRFFNQMNDEEWIKTAKNLQTYCQNDVRAMIAVEKYIHSLIKKYGIC